MRINGFTDSTDWHPATLWAMLRNPSCWEGGMTWRDWSLDASYTWYDGPLFQLRLGPIWLGLSY